MAQRAAMASVICSQAPDIDPSHPVVCRHLNPGLLQYLTTDKMVWCCTRSLDFHSLLIFLPLQILGKAGTALADKDRSNFEIPSDSQQRELPLVFQS